MDAPGHISGETSATYEGWRIVAVCFLVATFGWAFGFYGQSVYLAELNRLYGWPASLVSAATTFFYLFGAVLVAFVSEAVRSFGPRNCLLAGIMTLAAGGAMVATAATMLVLMIPVVLIFVGRPPALRATAAGSSVVELPSAARIRGQALRNLGFLTVAIAFALVLFAQVGFIVHLISFLDPVIGRTQAATAVATLTMMAVVGRVLFSTVIDRLNQRLASAISFASQAVALAVIINSRNEMLLLAACALFGFSVGNLITLPSLIVQREFDSRAFGVLSSLITAINQLIYAFG